MSLQAMTWAFGLDLPPSEKLIMLALADHADVEGYCFPGQETLAAKASVSERTLRTKLNQLAEVGLIRRERRYNEEGHRKTDGYVLAYRQDLPVGPTGKSEGSYRQAVAGTEEPSVEPSVTSTRSASAKTKATRIPTDFHLTDEMREWAKAKHPHVDVEAETEAFTDYWLATPGAKGTKVDWLATWRTWIRRAAERGGRGGGGAQITGRGPQPGRFPPSREVPPAKVYPKVDISDGFQPAFPKPLAPGESALKQPRS